MAIGSVQAGIRLIKGLLIGVFFALFLAGILVELLCMIPAVCMTDRICGPCSDRMPRINRRLIGAWLFLLRATGMLKDAPCQGTLFKGPCLLVSNHPGLFDVLFFIRDINELSVMVKASLAKKLPLGPVFRKCGYVLAPDGDHITPLGALQEAIERIWTGHRFLVFPEGTRSPKGGLWPFKTGVFRIAGMAGVPIQPVLIRNSPPFLPKEDKWYFPPSPTSLFAMEFWEPMDPPERGKETDFVQALEDRYRKALGITRNTNNRSPSGC